jgi:hypothetical protein
LDGLGAIASIDAEEPSLLEHPFEDSEILDVVKDMNSDKAPSTNGFFYGFLSSLLEWDQEKNYEGVA